MNGRRTSLYGDPAFAAGVENARLRRENRQLLEELADLRLLYEACRNDRDRGAELLTGPAVTMSLGRS